MYLFSDKNYRTDSLTETSESDSQTKWTACGLWDWIHCIWQSEVQDTSIHLLHPSSISFRLHLQRCGTLNRTADAETAGWLLMEGSLPALDTFHLRWLGQLSRSVHSQPVSGHSSPTLSKKSDQSAGTAVPHSSSLQSKLPSPLWIQD